MSITTMVQVVMDIYLQIVHHNIVTRMMDIPYQKVLTSVTESDLETLSGLKTRKYENSTFLTPLSKLAPRKTKKGPKSLSKAIFPVVILPLDDSDGFWLKI